MKNRSMMTVAAVVLVTSLTTGCANMGEREKGTAAGAGIGAVGGAVLSSATGGKAGTGAVVGGALGAVVGNIWSKRQEDRRVALEQATKGTGVDVSRTADDRLKVNIPSDVSFDFGSASIRPAMRTVLDPFAASLLGDANANTRVEIVGHTDSTGSESVNSALSVERAHSVRDYLLSQGVPAPRVTTLGKGEREPVADNASESGRARNRRVEIFLRESAG
ncbi:MAG: OmpA family protein [Burkholderiales bacterium]|nr:OmpA family protein [Burkholderiales bacterium]